MRCAGSPAHHAARGGSTVPSCNALRGLSLAERLHRSEAVEGVDRGVERGLEVALERDHARLALQEGGVLLREEDEDVAHEGHLQRRVVYRLLHRWHCDEQRRVDSSGRRESKYSTGNKGDTRDAPITKTLASNGLGREEQSPFVFMSRLGMRESGGRPTSMRTTRNASLQSSVLS